MPGPTTRPPLYHDPDLPVETRLSDLLSRLTREEKLSLLSSRTPAIDRLGIPAAMLGNEALHGILRPGKATVFPQAIALAATWDVNLVHNVAAAIADEARGKQNSAPHEMLLQYGECLVFCTPVVNMVRDPRWGRTQETYGEDPHLTSRIGVAYVKGMQGDDPVFLKTIAMPKHFVANNEEHNRFECDARIPERCLHEYYFPGFKACIKEGKAFSIMAAYNGVNGTPCHADRRLLTDILRDEWDFEGFVSADANGVLRMVDGHKAFPMVDEAAAAALHAGVDSDGHISQHAGEALKKGLISEHTVNQAARRMLLARFRLGLLDPPERVPYTTIPGSIVGCRKHHKLALRAARESIVLLKNAPLDNAPLLPLDPSTAKRIAVVGNNADVCLYGHYSGSPVHEPTSLLQGVLTHKPHNVEVRHVKWKFRKPGTFYVVGDDVLAGDGSTGEAGFLGEYFTNPRLAGEPANSRVDREINYNWKWWVDPFVEPKHPLSVRWTATFTPRIGGTYVLKQMFSSGFRLYVNDELVEDLWRDQIHGWDRRPIPLEFEAGKPYRIRIEFYTVSPERLCVKLAWSVPPDPDINRFLPETAAARECDVVIAAMGLDLTHECEGLDRDTLCLPEEQVDMVRKLAEVNPNLVLVLESGSPLAIPELDSRVPAVLQAWYPGEQGGDAIAEILFGHTNPAGRLPLTFYASDAQLPPLDDYDVTHGRTYMYLKDRPLYPFGHGLSYTSFEYGDLVVDPETAEREGTVRVSAEIRNTGDRAGDEVVQLYVRAPETPTPRPKRQLKAFRRVHLAAGAKQTVELTLSVRELSIYDDNVKGLVVAPGDYAIEVGASSADIRLHGRLSLA